MARRYEGRRLLKPSKLRGLVAGAVSAAVVISIVFHTGWGTISAFGLGDIYLLCPLGSLEAMLGSHAVILRALIALVAVAALVLLFGKAFCGWICPVGFLARFFSGKKAKEAQKREQQESAERSLAAFMGRASSCGGCSHGGADALPRGCSACRTRMGAIDTRHFVLLGALGTTALFGFPVFCIVCPVGLTFATVVACVRFVGFNDPSLGLLVFPAILCIELLVMRRWCHAICPISALMSLLSSFNRTFRPKVDETKCLRSSAGEACAVCASVCPERIDPRADLGDRPLSECIRCGRCVEACPQGAIRFTKIGAGKAGAEAIAVEAADATASPERSSQA